MCSGPNENQPKNQEKKNQKSTVKHLSFDGLIQEDIDQLYCTIFKTPQ